MSEAAYWPWWLGGLTLAAVAVLHVALSGRLLTVSGIVSRVLRWREDERDRQQELELADGGLDDALLKATLAQFGDMEIEMPEVAEERGVTCDSSPRVRLPVSAGATFIVCLAFGGSLSALSSGGWDLQWGLGEDFARLVGEGGIGIAASLCGGGLVGFGARMAGGCTSGHGLCGTARLQPGSIAATAAFFAGGTSVALLLGALS